MKILSDSIKHLPGIVSSNDPIGLKVAFIGKVTLDSSLLLNKNEIYVFSKS